MMDGRERTPSGETVLSLRSASFSYAGAPALRDVTMVVRPGDVVAVIGPNGSGKSTLMKGVLGLVPLTSGDLRVVRGRGEVGYLPQREEIDPEFPISLRQVVMMGRYRSIGWLRWPSRADRHAVSEALASVGLSTLAGKRFGDLSGGQQQRGLLARAIVSEPKLVLLDEPFNGLDRPNRRALLETLGRLRGRGLAALVSTHDLELARECTHVLLVNGRQIAYGPTEEVLTLPNVQEAFGDVNIEVDRHTLVVPDHSGHEH